MCLYLKNGRRKLSETICPGTAGREDEPLLDEYLCLWEITPEEVVQHWNWDELCENPRWYEDEIQPAFNQHNCHLLGRKPNHSAFNMSMLHDALPSVAKTVEMESPRMETPRMETPEMKMPVLEDA
uniref:Uncharacterized protein n=1 Tax=Coccidioides posadasii RMSCC 3488 TaxID=454284 RepID=A0A0J6FNV5_COCPO|nr:hypothetical protein CPAG_07412 [Coccidioides posadasii RMSCC 3488]